MTEQDAQLEEGWAIFVDWRDARERAGEPLPPSVACLLTRETITLSVLGELATHMATLCRLPLAQIVPAIRYAQGMIVFDAAMLGAIDDDTRRMIETILVSARRALTSRLAAHRERRARKC